MTVTCLADDTIESSVGLFKYTLVAVVDVGTLAVESNPVVAETDFDKLTFDFILDDDVALDNVVGGGTITTCS